MDKQTKVTNLLNKINLAKTTLRTELLKELQRTNDILRVKRMLEDILNHDYENMTDKELEVILNMLEGIKTRAESSSKEGYSLIHERPNKNKKYVISQRRKNIKEQLEKDFYEVPEEEIIKIYTKCLEDKENIVVGKNFIAQDSLGNKVLIKSYYRL